MGSGESDECGPRVRDACTRPTARRPRRGAAFDELLTEAVRGIERACRGRLRLDLRAGLQVAGRAVEPGAAETGYCSFFTFTLTATGRGLVLEVAGPESRTGVLDALAGRLAAAAGLAA